MQGDWAATTLPLNFYGNCTQLHYVYKSIAITLRDHVMNVVGIDVGYSNLKLAYGPVDGTLKTVIRTRWCSTQRAFRESF